MVKGLLRFALVWAIAALLTPYLNRLLLQLADRVPRNSFVDDVLVELSDEYSTSIIRSFGETLGDLAFGSKKG
ncbi:MAG TPA: hypothetical protein VFG86_14675 [Chloroflexota bacterium]|jgi:hypothetical protein|nr:hypothetical protein [Chloroflexota bacterium]